MISHVKSQNTIIKIVEAEYQASSGESAEVAVDRAKIKALEKASEEVVGLYISSSTVVENFKLVKDKITTYCSTVMRIKVLNNPEKEFWNNKGRVLIRIQAEVSKEDIKNFISEMNEIRKKEKNNIDAIIDNINSYSVIFLGEFPLDDINEIYKLQNELQDVREVNEKVLNPKKLEYLLEYDGKNLTELRQDIVRKFNTKEFILRLENQNENTLEFSVKKKIESMSDWPLYASGVTAIASIGIGTYSYITASDNYDKYLSAKDGSLAGEYRENTEKYDTLTLISGIAAGTSILFYFIYNNMYQDSKMPLAFNANLNAPNSHTLCLSISKEF